MHIEICGGIATGKTTLVTTLNQDAFQPVFETIPDFIEDFYSDLQSFNYEAELFFLLQHSVNLKRCKQSTLIPVCDYSFEQDYSYAESNLNSEEMLSYTKVFERIKKFHDRPALIIHLYCSEECQRDRIRFRNRSFESDITNKYLEITEYNLIRRLNCATVPVIHINTEQHDFRKEEVVRDIVYPLIMPYVHPIEL